MVRIEGFFPLTGNEDTSWKAAGYKKLVHIAISVRRDDLHDFALADGLEGLRELFFIPAWQQVNPKPRGPRAPAAREARFFRLLAFRLRLVLKQDPGLAGCVLMYARKHGDAADQLKGSRQVVAYMMERRWGARFEQLGLQRPLNNLEAFARTYLPRHLPLKDRFAEQRTPVELVFALLGTISLFDPTYPNRLMKARLHPLNG